MPAALRPQRLTDTQRDTVEANLGLVHHVLRTHNVPADVYDDRFQDGCIGLIRAVQTFDQSKGSFGGHAVARIMQAIGRGIEHDDLNCRRAKQNGDTYEPAALIGDSLVDTVSHDGGIEALVARLDAEAALDALGLDEDEVALLTWPVRDSARWFGVNAATVVKRRARLRAACRHRVAV